MPYLIFTLNVLNDLTLHPLLYWHSWASCWFAWLGSHPHFCTIVCNCYLMVYIQGCVLLYLCGGIFETCELSWRCFHVQIYSFGLRKRHSFERKISPIAPDSCKTTTLQEDGAMQKDCGRDSMVHQYMPAVLWEVRLKFQTCVDILPRLETS